MTRGPDPPTDPRAQAGFHLPAKTHRGEVQPGLRLLPLPVHEVFCPESRFRMDDSTLEDDLRQLIDAHAGMPEVTIAWQGSEPVLLGLDLFPRSVGIAEPRHVRVLVGSSAQERFGSDTRKTLPAPCRGCDGRFACHGRCPENRFIGTPVGEERSCGGGRKWKRCRGADPSPPVAAQP